MSRPKPEFVVMTEDELRAMWRVLFNRPRFWIVMALSIIAGWATAEIMVRLIG